MAINFTTLATGALGFTIALAWNNAVSKTIGSFFPPLENLELSKKAVARHTIIYAIVITLLVIIIVLFSNHIRKLIYNNVSTMVTSPDMKSKPLITSHPDMKSKPLITLWNTNQQ